MREIFMQSISQIRNTCMPIQIFHKLFICGPGSSKMMASESDFIVFLKKQTETFKNCSKTRKLHVTNADLQWGRFLQMYSAYSSIQTAATRLQFLPISRERCKKLFVKTVFRIVPYFAGRSACLLLNCHTSRQDTGICYGGVVEMEPRAEEPKLNCLLEPEPKLRIAAPHFYFSQT